MTHEPPQTTASRPAPTFTHQEVARVSVRAALVLLLFTVVFTAFMAGTFTTTKPLVDASLEAEKLRLIGEVLPPNSYDNDLLADHIILPAEGSMRNDSISKKSSATLGTHSDTLLYRARLKGLPVALVTEAVASDGYSGRIGLIMAVSASGRLLAVRVTQHKETPGLGDYIDPKKDRNKRRPWISQFTNQGFDQIPLNQWRVKKDGGQFDQMTGATISARAVTNATGHALEWLLPKRDTLFAQPPGTRYEEGDA